MTKLPSIPGYLNQIVPSDCLRRTAHEGGTSQRSRFVDIIVLFWVMILAPASGVVVSIASLSRSFAACAGRPLAPPSFQKRLSPGFARFQDACLARVIEVSAGGCFGASLFAPFSDVVAVDSSVVELRSVLSGIFPGTRTNTSPAAAKINVVYRKRTARFRIVGVRHPASAKLHFYETNVPPDMMSPRQIQAAYTARWMVDLVFDEL